MDTLRRASSWLLIGGGAVMTALLVALVLDPESPALYGFFLVAPAIGLGVLGAQRGAGTAAGRIGGVSAWVAAGGGVTVVIVGIYAIATDQFILGTGVGSDDPMAIPFMLTSTAWMVGSLGFAVALVRSRTIPGMGAWLILVGTLSALILGTILGMVAPDLSPLSALPYGIGWVVVGWALRGQVAGRSAPAPSVAG